MKKSICFFAIFLTLYTVGNSQDLSELNSKYKKFNGSPSAYVFNDKIWFSVEKSADGKVCTMIIYPKRNLFEELSFEEFLSALDSIIPPDKRGAKEDSFIGGATGGGFSWTTFQYENVNFTFPEKMNLNELRKLEEFSFKEIYSNAPESSDVETKPFQEIKTDDFAHYRKLNFKTASVRWKNMECSAK